MGEGQSYGILVYAHNVAGFSKPQSIAVVAASAACGATAVCVEADATKPRGAASLRAQGLLHGVTPASNPALTSRLNVKQWRISAGSPSEQAAEASPASVTMELSDAWYHVTQVGGVARAPWANWTNYAWFVTAQVRAAKAAGAHIDYWDIQNEPNIGQFPDGSTELVYEQFRVAYNAIKSVDPNANVVGPSLAHFWWVSGPGNVARRHRHSELPQLCGCTRDEPGRHHVARERYRRGRVLRHAAGRGRFGAGRPRPDRAAPGPRRPEGVRQRVRLTEQLPGAGQSRRLCGRARTGRRRPGQHHVPRGDVGTGLQSCSNGTLDGALLADNQTPRGTYWMRVGYAGMQGTRLSTNSTDPNVTIFATADGGGGYQLMVSRHQGCAPSVNVYCDVPGGGPPPVRSRSS